ncbi:putative DNA-binding domain-containing protein [Alteromonas sediminis]|nr:putative DNA-binding domain-containing protein [Alteromonas sediminis]
MSESDYQQALVAAIVSEPPLEGGTAIYRNNWIENAHRALSVSFPTVKALLGENNFRLIVRYACAKSPKTEYDWGEWALDELPAIIEATLHEQKLLDTMDFVVDCAKLDAALFRCQRSVDPLLDTASLSLLEKAPPESLRLNLANKQSLVTSNYPLNDLYDFVHRPLDESESLKAQIQKARDRAQLRYFLVYRTDFNPLIKALTEEEAQLHQLVVSKTDVATLFEKCTEMKVDFSSWLGESIAEKRIIGINHIESK